MNTKESVTSVQTKGHTFQWPLPLRLKAKGRKDGHCRWWGLVGEPSAMEEK